MVTMELGELTDFVLGSPMGQEAVSKAKSEIASRRKAAAEKLSRIKAKFESEQPALRAKVVAAEDAFSKAEAELLRLFTACKAAHTEEHNLHVRAMKAMEAEQTVLLETANEKIYQLREEIRLAPRPGADFDTTKITTEDMARVRCTLVVRRESMQMLDELTFKVIDDDQFHAELNRIRAGAALEPVKQSAFTPEVPRNRFFEFVSRLGR